MVHRGHTLAAFHFGCQLPGVVRRPCSRGPDSRGSDSAIAVCSGWHSDDRVINALHVTAPQQVLLEVRIIEASRNAARELGVSLFTDRFGSSDLATYVNSATASHYRSATKIIRRWWKANA